MNEAVRSRNDRRHLMIIITTAVALYLAIFLVGCSTKQPANAGILDVDITMAVEAGLAAESQLDPYAVAVRTDKGIVHLSGLVASSAERDAAEQIASASRGVVRVENYIRFGSATVSD